MKRVLGFCCAVGAVIGLSSQVWGTGQTGAEAAAVSPVTASEMVAQNGAKVAMPAIAALDCDDMRHVLRRLDMTNYRGVGVIAPDHPDFPIFLYEDALASALYYDCTLRESASADPGLSFALGFQRN